MARSTTHKHGIKRIDRLLGNTRLQSEIDDFYRALAAMFIRGVSRPVVLVDWTDCGRGKCAISAALALHGRPMTIYVQVYSLRHLNSPYAHKRFVKGLLHVLGPDVRPIIVADAGFHAPFLELLLEHEWDFVCRVRGHIYVGAADFSWRMMAKQMQANASCVPLDLRDGALGRGKGIFPCRLVLADLRSARARKPFTPRGRGIYTMRAVRRAHEPWLIATSLESESAERILQLYGFRMQIELAYRDMKSGRLGWGLEHARTGDLRKFAVQVALVAIAGAATMVAGLAAERQGLDRRFQANTVRERRVISLPLLGRLALMQAASALPPLQLGAALQELTEILRFVACSE